MDSLQYFNAELLQLMQKITEQHQEMDVEDGVLLLSSLRQLLISAEALNTQLQRLPIKQPQSSSLKALP